MFMTQTMRWFGPADPVPLSHIRQAGATEVVTALHEIPNGEVWPRAAIAERRHMIEAAGLGWTVVESLPVHDAIKRGEMTDALIQAYGDSLRHLAAEGVRTVTYNFMPLLDWTRTDLDWRLPDGATALRFEWAAVAAYDIHILRRPGAEADYSPQVRAAAAARFEGMSAEERHRLERTIIAGLPGSEESFDSPAFLRAIDSYAGIDAEQLRANHVAFLRAVCPIAEEVGITLVVHPDDPPFPIFGLPRVVSTADDLARLFAAVPSLANGLCFCTGSFGARPDNDLPAMVRRFGERIDFLHLRAVAWEAGERNFHEAEHLGGDARMIEVVRAVVELSHDQGRAIAMRPDHGHRMMDDLHRQANPGYSLLGRMRGLAELRGAERGIAAMLGLTRDSVQEMAA
ncbi:mannonate dehydratase [Sphingomonas sp. SORGH_AS 950]|nr:mannonate dehydratase [Sphingomonas sp. SORGH_AS_0950]